MGRSDFEYYARGATAQEAYTKACRDDAYEHGHNGYTGTICSSSDMQELIPEKVIGEKISPKKFIKLATSDPHYSVRAKVVRNKDEAKPHQQFEYDLVVKDKNGKYYNSDADEIAFEYEFETTRWKDDKTEKVKIKTHQEIRSKDDYNQQKKALADKPKLRLVVRLPKYPAIHKLVRENDCTAYAVRIAKKKFFFFGLAMS